MCRRKTVLCSCAKTTCLGAFQGILLETVLRLSGMLPGALSRGSFGQGMCAVHTASQRRLSTGGMGALPRRMAARHGLCPSRKIMVRQALSCSNELSSSLIMLLAVMAASSRRNKFVRCLTWQNTMWCLSPPIK